MKYKQYRKHGLACLIAAILLLTSACSDGDTPEGTASGSLSVTDATDVPTEETTAGETDTIPAQSTDTETDTGIDTVTELETETETESETEAGTTAQILNSRDLLTFIPASPEGQVLTEDGKTPPILITNYNETAIDALGRSLPSSAEAGLPQADKYVGLFYSLWTSEITAAIDNSKALACDPLDPDHGSYANFCFWSEPETGYHKANDVWQIRRDLSYFAMAGIDFLYFDMTNGALYADAMTVFLDTCLEVRASGQMTPYIVPWCFGSNKGDGSGDMGRFYELFMTQEKYADLWFCWDGKPVAMIKPLDDGTFPILQDAELKDKLTFKKAWTAPSDRAKDYWLDNQIVNFGYGYGWSQKRSVAECAGIGCAGFANFGSGRSGSLSSAEYLDAFLTTDTMGEGLVLQAAFEELMKKNPECQVLLISRWNEWIAQNYKQNDPTDTGFVDQFNPEFSRDIEPMKGGYTDNYFYQMCAIIRRFKGVLPADGTTGSTTVDVAGDFSVWQTVSPVFTDFMGDTTHRDATDTTGTIRYINTTGRNDIVESRLTADDGMVYVYVRTAEAMTSYRDGENWMLLFIDTDNDKETGWEGYDHLINYAVIDDTTTTLCAYRDDVWQEIGTVAYQVSGNELMVALPRSLMGLTEDTFTLNFHWMDHVTNIYDLESWFTTGDSAPERRNNYTLTLSIPYDASAETILPVRDEDKIAYMPAIELTADEQAALIKGLLMTSYQLPEQYTCLPDFRLIEANANGTSIRDVVRAQDGTYYGLVFEGYLLLDADGVQAITMTCDDGARLYIDGRLLVECPYAADRPAGKTISSGISLRLAAGYHSIRVEYAEITGDGTYLELYCPGSFYAAGAVGEGLILREDFDGDSTDDLLVNFEIDEKLTLKDGWINGSWIEGRAIRYYGSDLRFYAMETRIRAGNASSTAYRSAIVLRIPSERTVSGNNGGAACFEPDNGDGDSTSYLGQSGIYLYCYGNRLEVAVHVKDASRKLGATSLGYTFDLPTGVSFGTGAVIRAEDVGDVIRIYCEGTLLATVRLSDVGQVEGQPFSGNGYRYAEIANADGEVVLTTAGYECLIPVEGDCGVVERANSFGLDYIELWQYAYTLSNEGYIQKVSASM